MYLFFHLSHQIADIDTIWTAFVLPSQEKIPPSLLNTVDKMAMTNVHNRPLSEKYQTKIWKIYMLKKQNIMPTKLQFHFRKI